DWFAMAVAAVSFVSVLISYAAPLTNYQPRLRAAHPCRRLARLRRRADTVRAPPRRPRRGALVLLARGPPLRARPAGRSHRRRLSRRRRRAFPRSGDRHLRTRAPVGSVLPLARPLRLRLRD